jgi:hypothetical protein
MDSCQSSFLLVDVCGLELCHTVIIRPFTQLFALAINYKDDVFRPKIMRTIIVFHNYVCRTKKCNYQLEYPVVSWPEY